MQFQAFEVLDHDLLNRFASNQQWLFENMPRARYQGFGARKPDGVKIAAGIAGIGTSKKGSATADVHFGNFFAPGCNPIVVATPVSNTMHRVHVSVSGLGQLHPSANGFRVHVSVDAVNKKNNKITRNFYVSWHAVGY